MLEKLSKPAAPKKPKTVFSKFFDQLTQYTLTFQDAHWKLSNQAQAHDIDDSEPLVRDCDSTCQIMKFYEIDIKTTENSAHKVQNYWKEHKHFNSNTKFTKSLHMKKFSHHKFVLNSVDDHTILLDILKAKLLLRPFHQGIASSPTKNPYVWAKPHHDYKLVIFSFIIAPIHTPLFEKGDKARNLKIEEYTLLRSYDSS